MIFCEDCGSKVYDGACVWCHEEVYIARQIMENDDPMPDLIRDKIESFQDDIEENQKREERLRRKNERL